MTLLIWPGWRSDAVVVTFILLPLAIGVSRGGFALWTYHEHRLVRGGGAGP